MQENFINVKKNYLTMRYCRKGFSGFGLKKDCLRPPKLKLYKRSGLFSPYVYTAFLNDYGIEKTILEYSECRMYIIKTL